MASSQQFQAHRLLDQIHQFMQKDQREADKPFVSRTRLRSKDYSTRVVIVLRVVLANPLTTDEILEGVLPEQRGLAQQPEIIQLLDVSGLVVPGYPSQLNTEGGLKWLVFLLPNTCYVQIHP